MSAETAAEAAGAWPEWMRPGAHVRFTLDAGEDGEAREVCGYVRARLAAGGLDLEECRHDALPGDRWMLTPGAVRYAELLAAASAEE